MTSAAFDDIEALERALLRHGSPMSAEEFIGILAEVGRAAESLTRGERDFLLEHADLTADDLNSPAQQRAVSGAATGKALAAAEVEEESMTTAEVAHFLGRAEANVRRSRLQGDLYGVGAGVRGTSLWFPTWQFPGDARVVPGLRTVLPALPDHLPPRVIETFMTTPTEALGGASPVDWLCAGGSATLVAELADELDMW